MSTRLAVVSAGRTAASRSIALRRRYFAGVVVLIAGSGIAIGACGSERPPGSGGGFGPSGGGVTAGGGVLLTGPCTEEGKVVACHVETGRHDGVVNCFSGVQSCTAGAWGPCGGTTGILSTFPLGIHPATYGGVAIQTVSASDASASAGGCASNPCNPNCVGIDVDAGQLQTSTFTSIGVQGAVSTPASFPAGVTGPKAAANAGSSAGGDHFNCASGHPPASFNDCAYDYCCATAGALANTCQPWVTTGGDNPDAISCVKAVGVDLELGLGCKDPITSHIHVPVCNRGTAATSGAGSLLVGFYPGNPNGAGSTSVCIPGGAPANTCTVDLLTQPIGIGKCIDIDVTAGASASPPAGITCTGAPTGNTTMMVNPAVQVGIPNTAGSATESGNTVTITTSAAHGFKVGNQVLVTGVTLAGYDGVFTIASAPTTTSFTYTNPTAGLASSKGGSAWSTPVVEADMCNNYSFLPNTSSVEGVCSAYGVQPPPPAATSYTYTAVCPQGFKATWNQFAYSTTVPNASDVLFKIKTAPLFADGGAGTFTAAVAAAHPSSPLIADPAVCPVSGPSPCPKDLAILLGASAATNQVLQLDLTLTATSAVPTVNSWQVTYNCVANE